MHEGKVGLLCALVLRLGVMMVNAECIDEEHMYECHAPDEEAEDLTCTACYPYGDNGHYNCSCWTSQQPKPQEEVYLTCQDALDIHKGETKSGVCTLKLDHLPAFQTTGNFDADCENGSLKNYVSCLTEMNCSNDDIVNMVSAKIALDYPDDCIQISVFNLETSNMDTSRNNWHIECRKYTGQQDPDFQCIIITQGPSSSTQDLTSTTQGLPSTTLPSTTQGPSSSRHDLPSTTQGPLSSRQDLPSSTPGPTAKQALPSTTQGLLSTTSDSNDAGGGAITTRPLIPYVVMATLTTMMTAITII